jgi:hypothetical protein
MNRSVYLLAFIDLLFNLLLGFTMMFIFSFLNINPPADSGKVDPPIQLMIEMEWSPESLTDIDIWTRGYEGEWVGFRRKDGSYYTLERDDRGTISDTIYVNGKSQIIKQNYEVVRFTVLPPGEYYVNIHYFTKSGDPEEVKLKVTQIDPFRVVYTGTTVVRPLQETTMVSFVVDTNGLVTDVRTDVQLPYVSTLPPKPDVITPNIPPSPGVIEGWDE